MKKLILLFGLTLVLAACGNESEEAHGEDHDEAEHQHALVLDMELTVDNDADPSIISIELAKDGEAYEADRVRFEVEDTSTEEIEWLNAEQNGDGLYSIETAEVEPGEYSITAHVNGPDDLHEHTDEVFEIE